MKTDVSARLIERGVQPSAQRVAVAQYVLTTLDHPTADRVFTEVRAGFPWVARATVYNTLNLFVEKGLLRSHTITEGSVVFDPNTDAHHHFIDETTGEIIDVPWEAVEVRGVEAIEGYEITEYEVVMRGRRKHSRRTSRPRTRERRTR